MCKSIFVFLASFFAVSANAILISSDSAIATEMEYKERCLEGGFMGCGLGYAAGPMVYSDQASSAGDTLPRTVGPGELSFPQNTVRRSALSGMVANFNCGYNWQLGSTRWMIGFIGGGSFSVMHAKPSYPVVKLSEVVKNEQAASVEMKNTKISDQGNFAAGIRWGYAFGKRVFLFMHNGWSIHRMVFQSPLMLKSPATDRVSAKPNVPKWFSFLVVGTGVDVRITENCIVGVSIDAHIGMRSRFSFNQITAPNPRISCYMKPVLMQALVNLRYFFPSLPMTGQ
jgi:hypothetical protein